MRSIRFLTSGKEAYPSPSYKIYHYHRWYHKPRVKISNFKITPAYQYQLRGWNRFHNLWGYKRIKQNPHRLQENILPHPLACIHIQTQVLKILQIIWRYPRFPKPGKHKRNPSKFNTAYTVPIRIFRQNFRTQASKHLVYNHLFNLPHDLHIYNAQGKKETIDTLLRGGDSDT